MSNMKPISDRQDYEKTQAMLQLMSELEEGRKSGEEEGRLEPKEMRAYFRIKAEKV